MADIRVTTPFEDATVELASDSEPVAAELYRLSEPLVRGVFPTVTADEYRQMTTRTHVAFAKVAARMNPKLLEACDLTLEDLDLILEDLGVDGE